MAVTGFELRKRLANKVGQPYTTFVDVVKTNRLFSDALLWAIKGEYKRLSSDEGYASDIGFVINTGRSIGLNGNQFLLAPIQISFITFQVATATVQTLYPHNLVTGDSITFSGVQTAIVPTINGNSFIVTVTSATTFTIPFAWISGIYSSKTGIITTSKMVSDYWDMLTIKAKYFQQLYGVTVIAASNTSPIVVTVDKRNNFRDGELLTLSGFTGNTNANGAFYIKMMGGYSFYLYRDKNLRTPVAGNGIYTGGGIITRQYYNYCKPYASDTKISSLNTPTVDKPRYEQAQRLVKIYPLDETCSEVTMDIIVQPPVPIDAADNVTDMTLYFPEEFLWSVVYRAADLFANPSRDMELKKLIDSNIQMNP